MKNLLFTSILLFSVFQISRACTPAFTYTVSPTTGHPHHTIFTNTSSATLTGGTITCTIAFGDGSSGSITYHGTATHDYATAGTYHATLYITVADSLSPSNNCVDSITETITVPTITGTQVLAGPANDLVLFPNPAVNEINVTFYGEQTQNVNLRVYDINGRVVKTLQQNLQQGMQNISLEVADLRPGLYSLVIETIAGDKTRLFTVYNH